MADLVVTASSVVPGTGAKVREATAGAAITAGQPCYLDASDGNKAKPADANASEATAAARGIAVNGAAAGQPVDLVEDGPVTFNAVLTKGTVYVLSANAGGIAPAADLASGHYVTVLGVAESTTSLLVKRHVSGVQV